MSCQALSGSGKRDAPRSPAEPCKVRRDAPFETACALRPQRRAPFFPKLPGRVPAVRLNLAAFCRREDDIRRFSGYNGGIPLRKVLRALMNARKPFAWIALAVLLLAGCTAAPPAGSVSSAVSSPAGSAPSGQAQPVVFTDALGYEVALTSWERVVSLYGSFAETWTSAGGQLVGATSDAIEERQLDLGDDVAIIGSVKQPSFEDVLALEPDFVILSADTAEHVALHDALAAAGIPHAYYRVDAFEDYLAMLRQFCALTGREDLYEKNGLAVQRRINGVLAAVQGQPSPTVLLVRAYSTGAKAKGADNLAGVILQQLGADNLVARHESLLEDLSLEEVIAADPDYIFVVTMGDEARALDYMADNFESNPAWAGLSAVQNSRYIVLPKELFHYKPNARWGESYALLAGYLYPSLKL